MSDDPGYLLDTNTVSDLIRGHAQVSARVRGVPMAQMAISAITCAELEYGLCKRPEAVRLRALVEAFLQRVTVLNWDTQAALGYLASQGLIEETRVAPGVSYDEFCVITILVRPGRGRRPSGSDSHVFRPMMIGWPFVKRRNRSKSSGISKMSPLSFPIARVFAPIAAMIRIS